MHQFRQLELDTFVPISFICLAGLDRWLWVNVCVCVCVCVCALQADSISHGFRCQYFMLVHPVRSFSAVSGNVPCNTVHLIKVVCLTTLCIMLHILFITNNYADTNIKREIDAHAQPHKCVYTYLYIYAHKHTHIYIYTYQTGFIYLWLSSWTTSLFCLHGFTRFCHSETWLFISLLCWWHSTLPLIPSWWSDDSCSHLSLSNRHFLLDEGPSPSTQPR